MVMKEVKCRKCRPDAGGKVFESFDVSLGSLFWKRSVSRFSAMSELVFERHVVGF